MPLISAQNGARAKVTSHTSVTSCSPEFSDQISGREFFPSLLPTTCAHVRRQTVSLTCAPRHRTCTMASNHAQKRRCLSIDDKVHIIDAVEKGERKKDVAARFGIPASSLSTILKRKNTILEAAAVGPSATRKRNRTAVYDDVDKATFAWFMEMLSQRVPLSGAVLQRQAVNFANILGCDSFKASSGWLDKFKKRHAIVSKVLCGESASADIVGAATWQEEELRDILERYAAEDIYNADESALFFQMLPGRTLALKGQRCEGGKQSKQRLSILFCVNSGTH